MHDIINLLPDSVANQIAAGEVIQRPASVVKELLENSVDAKSTAIQLIVKDAGKTLIQVIDDGTGMSETDARMCFERHATSKIKTADDLFSIKTMGFRGEALASIAAVAQVELKTRREEDAAGVRIEIAGSELQSHTACQCRKGTCLSVKNLFFNVPARRNFLKADAVEFRHILEEFQRVAIVHPEISFSLHHNNSEIFHLEKSTFRQRLVGIFGDTFNPRLVPLEEQTSIVNVSGFIGKPQFARKTRGEQYFFVNRRFIKSPYLHHAVQNAYEQLLPPDAFPAYFIHLEIDSRLIDINIHPTKTEIKFEDERSVYTILRAAVKQSLGKYNIAPSLDFEQETGIEIPSVKSREEILLRPPVIKINRDYNPFEPEQKRKTIIPSSETKQKEKFFFTYFDSPVSDEIPTREPEHFSLPLQETESRSPEKTISYQLHNQYILTQIKTGMLVIDQQAAHERILYEKFFETIKKNKGASQQQLFPQTLEMTPADAGILSEMKTELQELGYDIQEFGNNSFVLHGIPADLTVSKGNLSGSNAVTLLEKIVNAFKESRGGKAEIRETKAEIIAHSMAKNLSVKIGDVLNSDEMSNLVDELFACKMPYVSPSGKPTVITISLEELGKKFKQRFAPSKEKGY